MREPEQLRAMAEACEGRAAMLASRAAEVLLLPSPQRRPLAAELDGLADLHGQTARLAAQLSHVVGAPAPKERRPARGVLSTPQYLRDLRLRLRLRKRVAAAVVACMGRHQWPLIPAPRPQFDLGAEQQGLLNAAFTLAHGAVNQSPQAEEALQHGCFRDIPLNVGSFMAMTHLAYRLLLARKHKGPVRFLDVGCGGGLKVAIASQVFADAVGLEYDPGYVDAAARTFDAMSADRCSVFQADGLCYDGYGGFDVIYFFQPMSEEGRLAALERQIVENARPGTILLAPYHLFAQRAKDLDCTHITESVYAKDISADDARMLVAETHRMGPHISSPDHRLPPAAGWLAPLWRACLANGIDPDRIAPPH